MALGPLKAHSRPEIGCPQLQRRASLASIEGMPRSAVTKNVPKNTIAALSRLSTMCTAARSATDQSIG